MNRRRIFSLLMAGALSAGMLASSASAATINMNDTTAGGGYGAYRLMDLEQGLKNGHTAGDSCDLGTETGKAEHYAYKYTLTERFSAAVRSAINGLEESASDADVIAAIERLDDAGVRAFANAVYKAIKDEAPDATATGGVFSGVDQGYYLIFENGPAAEGESVSLVMLDTAGQDDIAVTSKEDVPELTKKIVNGDFDSGDRQDSDLVAVGDTVNYEIRVKAPSPDILANYSTYKYVVHDDISDGLKLDADSIKVYVGDNLISSGYTVRTDNNADNCKLEVEFADVKALLKSAADTDVVVQYSCTVESGAITGTPGNPNTAHLEFSNNPYVENLTTTTPHDKVSAFTFQLQVDKVDEDKNSLAGAKFGLAKKGADGEWGKLVELGSVSGVGGASFLVSGLDVGDYKLVETKTPAGYTKMDDVFFTISAEADIESNDPQLKNLTVTRDGASLTEGETPEFSVTMLDGKLQTAIMNVAGNRLPATGGAGVFALYVGGALLVFSGAGLVLYHSSKKKNPDA